MDIVPCPKCGRPVDLTTRRCAFDGFEVDSSHIVAVASTIDPGEPTSAPRERDLVGTTLGKYVVRARIGRGGMATVWRGEHTELGGEVAIKVLDASERDDGDLQARFLREAKVSARLSHEHVVRVIDFARDPSVGSYIVMELLAGQPLDRVLAEAGPLPEARAIGIALQLTDALQAAHELGIVHRDVKPANIFLTRALGTDFVKVVDFGIAKLSIDRATALTRSGRMVGTPLYMSPEQWDGEAVGPASDVYAVGVVLYEALTGRLPITGAVVTELAKNIALQAPRPLRALRPELSPAIEAVVLRCLEKEPKDRFASMTELSAALRDARQGVAAERSPRKPQTRRIVLGLGAVALVAGAAAATSTLARTASPTTPPPLRDGVETLAASSSSPAASDPVPTVSVPVVSVASAEPPRPAVRRPPARDAGAPPKKPAAQGEDDLLRKN